MISEITTDGKLTLGKGVSSKVLMKYMSHEAEVMLHQTRAEYDAIMVGSNTIKIDNSNLTVRLAEGKSPLRVIPNAAADLSPDSNVFNVQNAPTILAVTKKAPEERLILFREKGVSVVFAGEEKIDFPLLMDILVREFGVKSLIIEGGPTLNWFMLHHRLVDEIRLIHMPFIVGGADTPSLVGGEHLGSENDMIKLDLKGTKMAGDNLITEYSVRY
ncbi:MAG TPA: dihydrofolate reductase family protein [Methanocorpusculum sp.]|nr:dihydrofolate reductase family protein [Methanocorpusculum sp.]HJJ60009.1 dihydrofolate reductase family protein [Methanocorpusculum sp.]